MLEHKRARRSREQDPQDAFSPDSSRRIILLFAARACDSMVSLLAGYILLKTGASSHPRLETEPSLFTASIE